MGQKRDAAVPHAAPFHLEDVECQFRTEQFTIYIFPGIGIVMQLGRILRQLRNAGNRASKVPHLQRTRLRSQGGGGIFDLD